MNILKLTHKFLFSILPLLVKVSIGIFYKNSFWFLYSSSLHHTNSRVVYIHLLPTCKTYSKIVIACYNLQNDSHLFKLRGEKRLQWWHQTDESQASQTINYVSRCSNSHWFHSLLFGTQRYFVVHSWRLIYNLFDGKKM